MMARYVIPSREESHIFMTVPHYRPALRITSRITSRIIHVPHYPHYVPHYIRLSSCFRTYVPHYWSRRLVASYEKVATAPSAYSARTRRFSGS